MNKDEILDMYRESAIKEAKKRGRLLGVLSSMDYFIKNDLADIKQLHRMILKAIIKDEDDNY